MALLVILGAGASHDIIPAPNSGTQPPLTSEIFGRFGATLTRYAGAPEAWNRIAHGLERDGETLETQLQKLQDDAAGYDPLKRQLMAVQFFLQDVFVEVSSVWSRDAYPSQVNNLKYLVGSVEQWRARAHERILYVTFNYDTLLEFELGREVGTVFESMDRYLSDERAIVKVHGSCNWKRVASGALPALGSTGDYPAVIQMAPGLTATEEFHVIATPSQVDLDRRVLVPAVSIPVVRKSVNEFSCPAEHLARMREWMTDVTHVLVVGWHGAEEHFLAEMATHLRRGAEVTIVGRPDPTADPNVRLDAIDGSRLEWVMTTGVFGSARWFRTGFSRFIKHNVDDYVAALPT